MKFSEDRISDLSHKIINDIWNDDLADFTDEAKAIQNVKLTLSTLFSSIDEIDDNIRKKLKNVPLGSKEWNNLYQKFFSEEISKNFRN